MHITAEAYLQAWREMEVAFLGRKPVAELLLAVADLATAFERCQQFVCTSLDHPVGMTVWECTRQGVEKLSTQPVWIAAQAEGNREKGREVQRAIEDARAELIGQRPELGGAGMQSKLARLIEKKLEPEGENGAPLVRSDAIRKRLRKIS